MAIQTSEFRRGLEIEMEGIPYQIVERRPGDIDACYSDPSKAERELGWEAQYDLEKMCKDSYNFAKKAL